MSRRSRVTLRVWSSPICWAIAERYCYAGMGPSQRERASQRRGWGWFRGGGRGGWNTPPTSPQGKTPPNFAENSPTRRGYGRPPYAPTHFEKVPKGRPPVRDGIWNYQKRAASGKQ